MNASQPVRTRTSLSIPSRGVAARRRGCPTGGSRVATGLALLCLALAPARGQYGEGTGAGTALSFNGVNGFASIANSAALNVYPLTVMGWFRSSDQGLDRGIVNKYVVNSRNGYNIYFHQGRVRAWYFRDTANYVWDGAQGLNSGFVAGLWVHFAFTVDASGGKLYINGNLRDSRAWTGTPGATTQAQEVWFGRYGSTFLPGQLDEVSMWNVALSSNAIQSAMFRRLETNEVGLLAYWRFSEGAGTASADAAPSVAGDNAASFSGGVTWGASGGGVGPYVNSRAISGQTVNGVVNLNGEVNPLGLPTTAWFEWGTNAGYGNLTTPVNIGSGSSFVTAGARLSGLQPGRTYHYRYVATNLNGRANGANQTFTQPVWPPPGGVPPLRSGFYDPVFVNWVEHEARPEWDAAVPMTIEAWVSRTDTNRFETILSHDWPGSWWLGFAPRLRFYRGTNFAEVAAPVSADKWTHVAVSYDGALARFYVNGDLVGTRALNHNGAGKLRKLRVGHNGTDPNDFSPVTTFAGNLDEIRLWSAARSATEIREGMYREVRGEPALAAAFPRGGRIEEISGLVGSGAPPTEQVFGMVPRDLVVPRAAFPPNADGNINFGTEYLGAEELVIRYPSRPELTDRRAYFVHTDNDLFVAASVSSLLPGGWNVTNSSLSLFLDTTNAKPLLAEYPQVQILARLAGNTNLTTLLNGDDFGGFYLCLTPPGTGQPQPCTPRSLWQVGQVFCGGEISTAVCTEYRVSRLLLGSFDDYDGVALGQYNLTAQGDQTFVPEDGFDASPMTWLTMSYGEGSATLPRVRWSGRVLAGLTPNSPPLPGYRVSLIAGPAGQSQFTDALGRFSFDVPLPTNETIFAQAELEAFGRYTLPVVVTNGRPPQFVLTNRVIFERLPPDVGTSVQLSSADFLVQRPLPAAGIVSASPTNPMVGMAVRQGGVGGPGEAVGLVGTNLHAEMEYYLAPVSSTFPVTPEFWTLCRATVLTNHGPGAVTVRAPMVPEFVREYTNGVFIPSFSPPTQWRWVARDAWFRPGRVEHSYTGPFTIRRPPYPVIHGFQFDNDQTFPGLEEFLAAYGRSAYICVDPLGDCDAMIPDPLYWILWYPVHFVIIGLSGGSCVGMSGTALELFNGLQTPQSYDALALTANGIKNPGLPPAWDTSNTGGLYTRPPRPKDIWARIRMNHGTQTSAEYALHLISQLDVGVFSPSFGGDPVERLPELRAGTTGQAICMVQGFGGGHCVAPYRVEGNFGGDPNRTRIWVYDNNNPCTNGSPADSPCVTNQFIDIDHTANTYTFPALGWDGTALFTVPRRLYTDTHTAPGLVDLAQGVLEFLFLAVAGSADAHLTTPTGGEWGWRADGSFVNNLPGLRAVPILGSPANFTRSIPLLVPHSNSIPTINIHTRDTNGFIFHAAEGGTLLQLESLRSFPAHSNRVTLGMHSNKLSSFRYVPQFAHSNFIPRVGFVVHSNACAAFQWLGLAGEGGRAQEFRALPDRRAVEYCNETTHSNTHQLRIDAVEAAHSNNTCAVFGPFAVPPGAIHCVVMHEWPRVQRVRSELDLNADGTPDQVTIVTGTAIDSDGDGIPDAWEVLHQLNPMAVDCDDGADADPDHDGVSNYGEYLSDTDPHDPNSVLRLIATLLPGNRVRLTWKAVPGRRYEILYADDLWHVFRPLPNAGFPRAATSTEESFEEPLPAGGNRGRFYRVRLVP